MKMDPDQQFRSAGISRQGILHMALAPLIVAVGLIAGAAERATGARIEQVPKQFNLQRIFEEIGRAEYDIKWQEDAGALQSPNRAQNLRFTFPSAFQLSVESRAPVDVMDSWRVDLEVLSYGAANRLNRSTMGRLETAHNTAKFVTDEMIVDYINDASGLHQAFLVARPPASGNLTVTLGVTSDGVFAKLDGSGQFVSFLRADNAEEVMRYSNLHVFDAKGVELPSKMELTSESNIELWADDSNASYPVLVDPNFYVENLTGTIQSGANLGFSVAFMERHVAGDTYYGSVIVGAPLFDDGLTDQGEVFAYLADSQGLPASANWKAKGDQRGAQFGFSVAVAQPFDYAGGIPLAIRTFNDEWADLVVGEPNYNNGLGKAFVYYGDDDGLGTSFRPADRVYTGTPPPGGHFGWSVAVGDVTGDTYQDLIVGQPGYQRGLMRSAAWQRFHPGGAVFLYAGSAAGLSATQTASWDGAPGGSQAGFSVAFAGKAHLNAFSGNSILVGAPNQNASAPGVVYLLDWTGADLSQTWSYSDMQVGAKLGYAVSGNAIFDTNALSGPYRQFVVGAPFFDGFTTDEGRVYVFRTDSNGTIPPSPEFLENPGHQAGCRFGYALATGNINKSSSVIDDIIVGAPYYDTNPGDHKGRVFIFYGRSGAPPNPSPDQFGSGSPHPNDVMTGEQFGTSVAYLFKIKAGDQSYVVGGAPYATLSNLSWAGMAVLYRYSP